MNTRLKNLRKALGLTQQEFADKIGIKRNTIAQYEIGRNAPIEAVVISICREFSVNEEWLRNGTGDMFLTETKDDMISKMLDDVIKADESDFKRRLISALSKLDDDGWDNLEKLVDYITDSEKSTDKPN